MFNYYLSILICTIIDIYGKNSNCVMFISNNIDCWQTVVPTVMINYENSDNKTMAEFLHFGCQTIVIQNENNEEILENLEQSIKKSKHRFGKRKFIFAPVNNDQNGSLSILGNFNLEFIPNFLLIIPNDTNYKSTTKSLIIKNVDPINYDFKLITHKFVGKTNHREIVTLDFWKSESASFSFDKNLFPDKMANWMGRFLKISTFTYKPYSILENGSLAGTEMHAALEYVKKHNCNIEFVDDNDFFWGNIFQNWTGNGIMGNVVQDMADICFGALGSWLDSYTYLDYTKPIVRTGVTCLVPAPKAAPKWLLTLKPFELPLWSAVILSSVLAGIFWKVFVNLMKKYLINQISIYPRHSRNKRHDVFAFRTSKTFEHRMEESIDSLDLLAELGTADEDIFLLILRLSLVQPHPKPPKTTELRFLLMLLLFMNILLTCAYSSGLSSQLSVPGFELPIDKRSELAASGLQWAATDDAWVTSILNSGNSDLEKLVAAFKVMTPEEMTEKAKSGLLAFGIERLPSGVYGIGDYITEKEIGYLHVMKEDIYTEMCPMMLRKSSALTDNFDKLILRLHECGLPIIWEQQATRKYSNNEVQRQVKMSSFSLASNEPTRIQLIHLTALFLLWTVGIIVSIVSFLIEMIADKKECIINVFLE